jgi:hypothetical protein
MLREQGNDSRLQLVQLPDEFRPFRDPNYHIMVDGRRIRNFITSNHRTEIYFPILYNRTLH